MKIERMSLREFILGMAIIVFSITMCYFMDKPIENVTPHVKIQEITICDTNANGVVTCY